MADFELAIPVVLENMDGYTVSRDGISKYGIRKKDYPLLDIRNLTKRAAVDLYLTDWWLPYGYGEIYSQEIAASVLALSVKTCPEKAHTMLQWLLNYRGSGILIDGILGGKTLYAINQVEDPTHFAAEIRKYVGF